MMFCGYTLQDSVSSQQPRPPSFLRQGVAPAPSIADRCQKLTRALTGRTSMFGSCKVQCEFSPFRATAPGRHFRGPHRMDVSCHQNGAVRQTLTKLVESADFVALRHGTLSVPIWSKATPYTDPAICLPSIYSSKGELSHRRLRYLYRNHQRALQWLSGHFSSLNLLHP